MPVFPRDERRAVIPSSCSRVTKQYKVDVISLGGSSERHAGTAEKDAAPDTSISTAE